MKVSLRTRNVLSTSTATANPRAHGPRSLITKSSATSSGSTANRCTSYMVLKLMGRTAHHAATSHARFGGSIFRRFGVL